MLKMDPAALSAEAAASAAAAAAMAADIVSLNLHS
jgi:hypothetical protein